MNFIKIITIFFNLLSVFSVNGSSSEYLEVLTYDPFKKGLPSKSIGVYQIISPDKSIKHEDSSIDISKQLMGHVKKGILEPGDIIHAAIFCNQVSHQHHKNPLIRKNQEKVLINSFRISIYNPFTEDLPSKSKGVYQIISPDNSVKCTDISSDINNQILNNIKNGVLEQGDVIHAAILQNQIIQQYKENSNKPLIQELSSGDIFGTSVYNPFTESLPAKSRGIYQIISGYQNIEYIGSSVDINKRLSDHIRKGILMEGHIVKAILFKEKITQLRILDYERKLIKKYNPKLNKHPGAPGRLCRSDQILNLEIFFKHNEPFLNSKGQAIIRDLLKGKMLKEDQKIVRSLLYLMRLLK